MRPTLLNKEITAFFDAGMESIMFGEQLKTLRTAHKMNQPELAKQLGVSKQTVSNWENNNIMPSAEMVRKIALYFSCTSDYLLEINQPENDPMHINATGLQLSQLVHIQQIVADYQLLNTLLAKKTKTDVSLCCQSLLFFHNYYSNFGFKFL